MALYQKTYTILLNFNSSDETIQLYQQLTDFYKELNILVIDNDSNTAEKELLKNNIAGNNVIYNIKNYGYAEGNNIGIRKALKEGAEFIWILNPDIRINNNTLPILLETVKSDHKIAAIGPRICYRDNQKKIYSDGGILDKETYFTRHLNYNIKINDVTETTNLIETSYVNGSALLINVDAIRKIGIFYTDFFLYYEETEWCNRASKNNWTIKINTDAVVYHSSSEKSKVFHYFLSRNRIILAKIDGLNYSSIIKFHGKKILLEFIYSIMKFKKPSDYYFSRLKGYISGMCQSIKNYNESIFSI